MDPVHAKDHTWQLEASSPKWMEVSYGGAVAQLIDLLSSFGYFLCATAWADAEVKAPPRKVKCTFLGAGYKSALKQM